MRNDTLALLVEPPALHLVKLVVLCAITDQDAVVPSTHAEVLELALVIHLPIGLLVFVLAPAEDAVHGHSAVVRPSCVYALVDRAVQS